MLPAFTQRRLKEGHALVELSAHSLSHDPAQPDERALVVRAVGLRDTNAQRASKSFHTEVKMTPCSAAHVLGVFLRLGYTWLVGPGIVSEMILL